MNKKSKKLLIFSIVITIITILSFIYLDILDNGCSCDGKFICNCVPFYLYILGGMLHFATFSSWLIYIIEKTNENKKNTTLTLIIRIAIYILGWVVCYKLLSMI